jgi:hypothetical protein
MSLGSLLQLSYRLSLSSGTKRTKWISKIGQGKSCTLRIFVQLALALIILCKLLRVLLNTVIMNLGWGCRPSRDAIEHPPERINNQIFQEHWLLSDNMDSAVVNQKK